MRAASSCHGTRLAWCSASVTTISSPAAEGEARARRGAAAEGGVADRVGDEVEAGCGAARPDQLLRRGADEPRDRGAGFLVQLRRLGGERVGAAMDGRFSFVRKATSASITARGFWLVAAESR